MENEISIILKEYGLDGMEIKLYIFLVGGRELTAYRIAKEVKINKSTCYDVLERLIKRGFVSKIQKDNINFYSAVEITKTISSLKSKESLLLSLIPKFEKIKESGISKVRVFEDNESQKQFTFNLFNQIQKGTIKEICMISGGPSGVTGVMEKEKGELSGEEGFEIFLERLIREMKRAGFNKNKKYRGIWNEKFKGSKLLAIFSGLGEDRFLKNIPTLATTIIFGEYIAFSFTLNENHQVVEIQNKLIAEEMKVYFDYLWNIAKQ